MSREALSGAFSRKSIEVDLPSGKWMTMNPPPPILPAVGYVTAIVNPTATAASIALPPFLRISIPTFDAISSEVTTIPFLPRTGYLLTAFVDDIINN